MYLINIRLLVTRKTLPYRLTTVFRRKKSMSSLIQESCKFNDLIKKSILIKDGNPARYRLQTKTDNSDQSDSYRKITFGERDKNIPHKTILLVGETGTGKTTLINVMINYMLGVKREDKVWFEITDDQSDRTLVYSQTSSITVYEFYLQESPKHLTIIDTPGYGDTRGVKRDTEIAESLLKSAEEIHEIHAVCLVIDASQIRISERQQYIFDAVQSLFENDIAENIILLLTHSAGTEPKNALTAVKEAKIKYAVNDKNQPVFFLFNNRQSDAADEEDEMMQELSWNLSFKRMGEFFKFLDTIKPKTQRMSQDVLHQHEETYISRLKQCVQKMEEKQKELNEVLEALQHDKEQVNNKNFEEEVKIESSEDADFNSAVAKIMTCTEVKITIKFTKMEKRINEELKKKYDDKIRDGVSVVKKLEEELQNLEKEKIKHAFDAFYCAIYKNTDSSITLKHKHFLIEILKELNESEKVDELENRDKTLV